MNARMEGVAQGRAFNTAKKFLGLGFSLFPVDSERGDKKPYFKLLPKGANGRYQWAPYQNRKPNEEEVRLWFSDNNAGIALVCGPISGGFVVFDFEVASAWIQFEAWAIEEGLEEVLASCPLISTPGGGNHLYVRTNDPCDSGHKAHDPAINTGKQDNTLIAEIKADGGYVVAPGSPGLNYTIDRKGWLTNPCDPIPEGVLAKLIALLKRLDKSPRIETKKVDNKAAKTTSGIAEFNEGADLHALLRDAGWTKSYGPYNHEEYGPGCYAWIRPGKTEEGISATSSGRGILYNFSPNAGLPVGANDAFQVYAYTQHNGDNTKALAAFLAKRDEEELAHHLASFEIEANPIATLPVREIFPETVAEFIEKIAEAQKVHPASVALPVISTMAASVGASRILKINDAGWKEFACLWTILLTHSGNRKSAGHRAGVRPLKELNGKMMDLYKTEKEEWEEERDQAIRNKEPVPPPPNPDRITVSDITIEKLAEILSKNAKGLLLEMDEAKGWFGSFTRYSGVSSESKWLSMYSGEGETIDRKGSDKGEDNSIYLDRPLVSITGTTQPNTLAKTLDGGSWASGLAPRLIIACPPRRKEVYSHPPAGSDEAIKAYNYCVTKVFEALKDSWGEVTLSPEADRVWLADLNRRERRELSTPEGSSRSAQLAKICSIPARWALIHWCFTQIMRGKPTAGQIGVESINAGIALGSWVEAESERVLGVLAGAPADTVANAWLKTITGAGAKGIDATGLLRSHRSKKRDDYLATAEAAKEVLAGLVAKGWIEHFEVRPSRGPVQRRYRAKGLVNR
jgi:hypothetical protein